ncbi:uncharacterized protein LOC104001655 isoform X4 [Pan troglodytes]|uniref:uncharacterized protein LOC104001655 isoform X4 n=1 Tax=Pan troglodytes TaxID=9598 RepID=UPI0000E23328
MAAGGKGRGLQSVFFFPFLPSCKQCGYSLTGSDKLRKLRHWKMKATEVESDGGDTSRKLHYNFKSKLDKFFFFLHRHHHVRKVGQVLKPF